MYDESMDAINQNLLGVTPKKKLVFTSELIPTRSEDPTKVYVHLHLRTYLPTHDLTFPCRNWRLSPKQDHLVCFLGGSLLLGATEARTGVPPDLTTFSEKRLRDWNIGMELIRTCMETHKTATYV